MGAEIFKDLKIKQVDLLTNNPDKIDQLQDSGIQIHQRISLEIEPNEFDLYYLQTKKNKFHHLLNLNEAE